MSQEPHRAMFVYWGRRGALTKFTLGVARAAITDPEVDATISISRQNESFASFEPMEDALLPVDTFTSNAGALLKAWRIPAIRRQLYERIRRDRIQTVIELMPHVWSPFVMPVIRKAGARYCTIIHDGVAHPGDPTAHAKRLTDQSMRSAIRVFTLSDAVATRLLKLGQVRPEKLAKLFHPDLIYNAPNKPLPLQRGQPIRLLFLGRIMPYKGLDLFVDAMEILRERNIAVQVGVFGNGPLGDLGARLERLDAEIANRWLSEAEIGNALSRYHALVLSHRAASQSGVVATAMGAGLPVVATPVGALPEQVSDGITGMIAQDVSATAIADAVVRLFDDPNTYLATQANIAKGADQRSMAQFVKACIAGAN